MVNIVLGIILQEAYCTYKLIIPNASLAYYVDQGTSPGGCGRVLPRPKDSRGGRRRAGKGTKRYLSGNGKVFNIA